MFNNDQAGRVKLSNGAFAIGSLFNIMFMSKYLILPKIIAVCDSTLNIKNKILWTNKLM